MLNHSELVQVCKFATAFLPEVSRIKEVRLDQQVFFQQ